MDTRSAVQGSLWLAAVVTLLVALGAQVVLEHVTPMVLFDMLFGETQRQGPVVRVAGESFWREDALIRAAAFAVGARVGCRLAVTPSWRLLASLLVMALVATAFAQFPPRMQGWQRVVWTLAAPAGVWIAYGLSRLQARSSVSV